MLSTGPPHKKCAFIVEEASLPTPAPSMEDLRPGLQPPTLAPALLHPGAEASMAPTYFTGPHPL